MKINKFFVLAIVLVLILILSAKKSIFTTVKRYAIDEVAAYAVSKNTDGSWKPSFENAVKVYKKGEFISNTVIGSFSTVNDKGETFDFLVFEVPFVFGTVANICIVAKAVS